MDSTESALKSSTSENASSLEVSGTKNKTKNRARKRKRLASDSSSDDEHILPDNTLEMEKNVHASAVKNNLDDKSVRKILKKVVTNDHVLAIVKLREEEGGGTEDRSLRLTRAKVKELMKESPNTAAWGVNLVPIKHIPVKTRPEVKALIAQELPEDEDDDEYEPTNDDVPSDDDQTLESCSDIESQPRTPATPKRQSPKVAKDGPFKIPQDVSTPTRRKQEIEEEATIALRTRSKLSLSSTSIEHIESTFVPPDDLPMPAVDDLWNEFLAECLNPAPTSKHEDDDEADPEYNVAADPDAQNEDEERQAANIIKISKKELNELMTELLSVMPEDILANPVLKENGQNEIPTTSGLWEGKQEKVSDDEATGQQPQKVNSEKRDSSTRFSIGKTEPEDEPECGGNNTDNQTGDNNKNEKKDKDKSDTAKTKTVVTKPNTVDMSIEETSCDMPGRVRFQVRHGPPPSLRNVLNKPSVHKLEVRYDDGVCILPEQILILQQQLRQHIQLSTSNFLQLYVHPMHWTYAPTYKEYLESLIKMSQSTPNSVVDVCNLKPAMELITSWEKTVAEDTPENAEMVQYIQSEAERCRRRAANNSLYVGEFHETFKNVVANSCVFLYPYLLPSMPYRADVIRKFSYLRSEDELIALGLDEFWQHVEDNPHIYKHRHKSSTHNRWGISFTIQLIVKHMMPWLTVKTLKGHVYHIKKHGDKDNPILKFFKNREVTPVQHKLLPFNPKLTLYEQPEHEMPRIWVRYLAKTSKRFRAHLYRRSHATGERPLGVPVELGQSVSTPLKNPLPIDFTNDISCRQSNDLSKLISSQQSNDLPKLAPKPQPDKFDIHIQKVDVPRVTTEFPIQPYVNKNAVVIPANFYRVVKTNNGSYLIPISPVPTTNTVTCVQANIITAAPEHSEIIASNLPETSKTNKQTSKHKIAIDSQIDHCRCCVLLRKICKRQTLITDYFRENIKIVSKCPCGDIEHPRITKRLKLLINNFKSKSRCAISEVEAKLNLVKKQIGQSKNKIDVSTSHYDLEDLVAVTSYQLKLLSRLIVARKRNIKQRVVKVLTHFKPNEDDPVKLANNLYYEFGVELVDMHKEFIGFLTAEQADEVDAFKDYFVNSCVSDLIKKIEEHVCDKDKQSKILSQLNALLYDKMLSACDMCCALLATMYNYPQLAQYVFSLFPHRRDTSSKAQEGKVSESSNLEHTKHPETKNAMDYEADHSNNGDEDDTDNESEIERPQTETEDLLQKIKTEETIPEKDIADAPGDIAETPELAVNKIEEQDYSESDVSMVIASEEDIKSEELEWKRDEDKLILEILNEHLTPEQRNDKTIMELIEEKNIYVIISESLTHKSIQDIRERVYCLLKILVLSED